MVALRKNSPALVYGAYKLFDAANPKIYAYTRTQGNEELLVILNFSNYPIAYTLPKELQSFSGTTVLINNYPEISTNKKLNNLQLQPWQAVIFKK